MTTDQRDGSLVLILHTHLPYVLRHGAWPHGSDWLCEAAAECYIPLLNMMHELVEEGITPGITVSISPVVAEQLDDEEFPAIFNEWLEARIDSAESDLKEFEERSEERHLVPIADYWADWFRSRYTNFNERYGRDLCGAFRRLAEAGAIALQTCGATHGYFPLLGRDSSIHAQLEVARTSHLRRFGSPARGVWMPECAYRPHGFWVPAVESVHAPAGVRSGVDELLAAHGFDYTVVDSHLTQGGKPLGLYAGRFESVRKLLDGEERYLPLDSARSVHDLYRISSTNRLDQGHPTIFTRDAATTLQVWSGSYGYPGDPEYLEFHKRHHNSGHRYWRVTGSTVDLGEKGEYHFEVVENRIREQAEHFVTLVERRMREYRERTGRPGTLGAPFDTELFGHWWFEGPRFLGEVIRRVHASSTISMRTAPDELDAKDPNVVISIPEGSWGEGGMHKVWLNEETAWTWPQIYEVEADVARLLEDADPRNATQQRVLRQLLREQLLLQASDWQFLITTKSAADYAEERFREHHENAVLLAGMLERMLGDIPLSMGDRRDLERLEAQNRLFPELDPSAWRPAPTIAA